MSWRNTYAYVQTVFWGERAELCLKGVLCNIENWTKMLHKYWSPIVRSEHFQYSNNSSNIFFLLQSFEFEINWFGLWSFESFALDSRKMYIIQRSLFFFVFLRFSSFKRYYLLVLSSCSFSVGIRLSGRVRMERGGRCWWNWKWLLQKRSQICLSSTSDVR